MIKKSLLATSHSLIPHLLPLILLFLLGFLAYLPTFSFQFVWDDFTFIEQWPQIHNPLANLPELLGGNTPPGHEGVYRPLRSLIYSVSYHFFGTNPTPYHIQAFIVLITSTYLVYWLAQNLHFTRTASLIASLLFILHPVHVESISFITTSFDIIGVSLGLLALNLTLFALKNHSTHLLYALATIIYFLAFLTYELTYVFPIIASLYILFHHRHHPFKTKSLTYLWTPFILIWFLRIFVIQLPSRSISIFDNPLEHLQFIFQALSLYFTDLLAPFQLSPVKFLTSSVPGSFYFDHNQALPKTFLELKPFNLIVLVSFLLLLLFSLIRARRTLAWLLTSLAVSLLPVLQFFPQDTVYSTKYLYLSSVFFSLTLVLLLFPKPNLTNHLPSSLQTSFKLALVCIYLGFLGHTLISYNSNWFSSTTLWSYSIFTTPRSALAHNNLGSTNFQQQLLPQAQLLYQRALALNPNQPLSHANLGLVLLEQNMFYEAIDHLDLATSLEPDNLDFQLYHASALSKTERLTQAAQAYEAVLVHRPDDVAIHSELAHIYHTQQKLPEASKHYLKITQLAPDQATAAYNNLGNISTALGDLDQAIYYYRQVLMAEPNNLNALQSLRDLETTRPGQ